MKPDHILVPRVVGPESNPETNGWYMVSLNTESFHKDAFFDIETGWDTSMFSSDYFPAIWYEELPIVEYLRDKLKAAFVAGQDSLEPTTDDDDKLVTDEIYTYYEWFNKAYGELKQQENDQ